MLKVLLLRKKIDNAKKALEALRAKDAEFDKRQEELEGAIEEAAAAEGEEAAEAQKAVEEEAEKFDAEKKEHEDAKKTLSDEIAEMENDLAEAEKEQETEPQPEAPAEATEERKVVKMPTKRNRFFANVDTQVMFERDDVKAYLAEIRSCIANKRELTNVGLTIPEVFVGLIKENVENYSKLYKHVNVQAIAGKGREIVQGTVAEAIWTECCAVLNELSLAFNDVEIDCYKVAGYYKVCNAVLEDNDVDLATKLLEALSQAIGLAVDKAILYGRNSASAQKMPLGILSRLAQTSEPGNYSPTAETVSVDANGQIVTGVAGTMPVVGGVIEVLNFIPDNTIIGGYFDLYLLGERAGAKFAQSEHVFFIQDQTAFKGTARYDGQPVIAEAFVAIGLEGTTPDATQVAFAPDEANVVKGIILSASAVTVEEGEDVTVSAQTIPVDGPITWSSSDETKATVDNGVITGVASGSAVITAVSGSASASVAVTVTT